MIAEPNNLFGGDELKFIKDEGLIEPNELLKLEKGKLFFLENNVKARRNAEQISENNRKGFRCSPVHKKRIGSAGRRNSKIQTAKKKRVQDF